MEKLSNLQSRSLPAMAGVLTLLIVATGPGSPRRKPDAADRCTGTRMRLCNEFIPDADRTSASSPSGTVDPVCVRTAAARLVAQLAAPSQVLIRDLDVLTADARTGRAAVRLEPSPQYAGGSSINGEHRQPCGNGSDQPPAHIVPTARSRQRRDNPHLSQ